MGLMDKDKPIMNIDVGVDHIKLLHKCILCYAKHAESMSKEDREMLKSMRDLFYKIELEHSFLNN